MTTHQEDQMTAEPITAPPYEREARSLPDKNGTPVAVGDWVRLDEPMFSAPGEHAAQITGLHPREGYQGGNISNKTGLLDLQHSHVQIAVYRTGAEPWPIVSGEISTGRGLGGIEKVEDPDEIRRLHIAKAQVRLINVEHRLAHFRGERIQAVLALQALGVDVPA